MSIDTSDLIKVGELHTSAEIFSTEKLSDIIMDLTVKQISVDSTTGEHSFEKFINPLSVATVSETTFEAHILGSTPKNDGMFYMIEGDNLNGYGKRVVNVATPEEDDDAANKAYVDYLSTYVTQLSAGATTTETNLYYANHYHTDQLSFILSAEMIFG